MLYNFKIISSQIPKVLKYYSHCHLIDNLVNIVNSYFENLEFVPRRATSGTTKISVIKLTYILLLFFFCPRIYTFYTTKKC